MERAEGLMLGVLCLVAHYPRRHVGKGRGLDMKYRLGDSSAFTLAECLHEISTLSEPVSSCAKSEILARLRQEWEKSSIHFKVLKVLCTYKICWGDHIGRIGISSSPVFSTNEILSQDLLNSLLEFLILLGSCTSTKVDPYNGLWLQTKGPALMHHVHTTHVHTFCIHIWLYVLPASVNSSMS